MFLNDHNYSVRPRQQIFSNKGQQYGPEAQSLPVYIENHSTGMYGSEGGICNHTFSIINTSIQTMTWASISSLVVHNVFIYGMWSGGKQGNDHSQQVTQVRMSPQWTEQLTLKAT